MSKCFSVVILSALLLLLASNLCCGGASSVGSPTAPFPPIVPHPLQFANGSWNIFVDGNHMKVTHTGYGEKEIQSAFTRFCARTFVHQAAELNVTSIGVVDIKVTTSKTDLQLGVDEFYILAIDGMTITITSHTVYGAYHALETLSQLIGFDFDKEQYVIRDAPWYIVDAPRFSHRGILIDTSRHFLPLPTLRNVVDSLTYAKFNTLHWHLVDAESFPFDSPTYPQLGRYSSYTAHERYTVSDMKSIVEYAKERGVRVMVEFDVPGHTGAMCKGMPEICPHPLCSDPEVGNWALDPTNEKTYEVVGGVIKDLAAIFPEKLFHLGGDEVNYKCWQQHPYIMKWIEEHNTTLTGAYLYFVKRAQSLAAGNSRNVVGWQEIWDYFGTSLDQSTIIHQWLWGSTKLPKNVTSHGYRLIWSDSSVWYLDHLDRTWQAMYAAEPCKDLTEKECDLVLGGEACQWGETIDTSDIFQTIWPRAAAVAERLWSPSTIVNVTAAEDRMVAFRCLLNRRGVAAAPIKNSKARVAPPNAGSCFWQ